MREYCISFQYEHINQKARVIRTEQRNGIEFNIRPIDPSIVRRFGCQMKVFKTNGRYWVQKHISPATGELFNVLVKAIHIQEEGRIDYRVKYFSGQIDLNARSRGAKNS